MKNIIPHQLFINLPVKDVAASRQFYNQLGFTVNPLFSFNDQQCMVFSEQVYIMLQAATMFNAGPNKQLANP